MARKRRKRRRKIGAFQMCMRRKLKGKKVTRAMFKRAAKACARKRVRRKRRKRRRRRR